VIYIRGLSKNQPAKLGFMAGKIFAASSSSAGAEFSSAAQLSSTHTGTGYGRTSLCRSGRESAVVFAHSIEIEMSAIGR